MRRPLFGNGIPQRIGALETLEVFDTTDFAANANSPPLVLSLTLYLWWIQNGAAGPFTAPGVGVIVDSNGFLPATAMAGTYLDALWDTPTIVKPPAPLKMLDRYMVRGDQQVSVSNLEDGSAIWVWGYFESVGEAAPSRPFRGLQPNALSTPFDYPPTVLQPLADENLSAVVHQLDTRYIDLVTLDIQAQSALGEEGHVDSFVTLPGGAEIPMASQSAPVVRLFDGIPMRAPSSAQTALGIHITTDAGVGVSGLLLAHGSFDRR